MERITIFVGHYGSGKTEVAVNYAIKLKEEGKTVIISTHIMSEAEKLCDRLGVIISGKKVAEGTLAEVLEQTGTNDLEDAFFELYKKSVEGGAEA